MTRIGRLSDQLYNWSDNNDKRSDKNASTPRQSHTKTSFNAARVFTWVAYRAVQEMWQSRLQVCQWAGTWSQILFIDKYCGITSRDDLCTPRVCTAGSSIPGQSNGSPQTLGRDLRNQLRTVEKPGRLLSTKLWIRVLLCG